MRFNVSGQALNFSLVSALSGNPVTGASGQISGIRCTYPTTSGIVLSGNIVEIAGGLYRANLFDWDTSGQFIGYQFTASGCVPVTFDVETDLILSGNLYPASGAFVTVPISAISGVQMASGIFVVVPISTLSGIQPVSGLYTVSGIFVNATASVASGSLYLASGSIFINTFASGVVGGGSGNLPSAWGGSGATTVGQNLDKSGYFVNGVLSGAFSGQPVTPTSGQTYIASGSFVVGTVLSGTINLGSGVILATTFASGVLGGGSGMIATSWGGSGAVTVAQNLDKSGYFVNGILSGLLSGQQVNLTSGQSYTASGIFVNATANVSSGVFVTVPISSISGVSIASGQLVNVFSGQLSGQIINLTSGQSYIASGVYPASGAFVNATANVSSGVFVTVPISSISGINIASGQSVSVFSGQLSGQPIAGLSGFIYPASGVFVNATATVTSGQVYLASGQAVSLNSGQSVSVYSGQLSGQPIAGLSGFIYPASGVFVNATANVSSGVFVTVPISSISGVNIASGQVVNVFSGQLSGQQVNLTSGQSYIASGVFPASGAFVNVPPSTISGVQAASGIDVVVPIASISGNFSVVPLSTLSGIQPVSGLYPVSGIFTTTTGGGGATSGLFVTVPISSISGVQTASGITANVIPASISGVNVIDQPPASGTVYVGSGSIFPDFMRESMANVTNEAIHSVLNAARKLTNKWDTTTNSGFLTVFKEDAVTVAYTQALTSQSGASPVVALGDA